MLLAFEILPLMLKDVPYEPIYTHIYIYILNIYSCSPLFLSLGRTGSEEGMGTAEGESRAVCGEEGKGKAIRSHGVGLGVVLLHPVKLCPRDF